MNPLSALATKLEVSLPRETLGSGLTQIDDLTGGFPRGAISEVIGAESSGRTAVIHALLAAATGGGEICCYIDTHNNFDPRTAAGAGVVLPQLVWIRCSDHADHAFKAADLILHAGGFGVVVLDIARISPRVANRIPLSYWYRFRRAVETTPTILALIEKDPMAKSCAALMLELKRDGARWAGAPGFELFRGMDLAVVRRKPVAQGRAELSAYVGF
jgi:recombination protein RecA